MGKLQLLGISGQKHDMHRLFNGALQYFPKKQEIYMKENGCNAQLLMIIPQILLLFMPLVLVLQVLMGQVKM